MKKTIAQQLNIKEFPFEIKDKNDRLLYFENSHNCWARYEYDSDGNRRYYENSDNFWRKIEFNEDGSERYYETSDGVIIDYRPKDDVITLNGKKYIVYAHDKFMSGWGQAKDGRSLCATNKKTIQ